MSELPDEHQRLADAALKLVELLDPTWPGGDLPMKLNELSAEWSQAVLRSQMEESSALWRDGQWEAWCDPFGNDRWRSIDWFIASELRRCVQAN